MKELENYKERESDKKINLLIQQVHELQEVINRMELKQQEIGLNQEKITLPTLLDIKNCLWGGNGHAGIVKEHVICQKKLEDYDKIADKLVGIIITIVVQFVFTGAGLAWMILRK
jgi:hypothetical protein